MLHPPDSVFEICVSYSVPDIYTAPPGFEPGAPVSETGRLPINGRGIKGLPKKTAPGFRLGPTVFRGIRGCLVLHSGCGQPPFHGRHSRRNTRIFLITKRPAGPTADEARRSRGRRTRVGPITGGGHCQVVSFVRHIVIFCQEGRQRASLKSSVLLLSNALPLSYGGHAGPPAGIEPATVGLP